jgi:hypothetical protein
MIEDVQRYRAAATDVVLRKSDRSKPIDRVNVLVGGAFVTLFLALTVQAFFEPGTDAARNMSLPLVVLIAAIAVLLVLEVFAAFERLLTRD